MKWTEAFGKLETDAAGQVTAWHPLVDHMADVAACFGRLAACHAIRRALHYAAGRELNDRDIARLSVLVFLHDLGKANAGFQAKRWKREDVPKGWPGHAGHGAEARLLFDAGDELQDLLAVLPINQMAEWGDAAYSLLIASLSHHGRPVPIHQGDWSRAIWRPVAGSYSPKETLAEIGSKILHLYPKAFRPGGLPLPDISAFGHLFAGLIQLVDWLGSSKRFFPFTEAGENRFNTAVKLAEKAIRTAGLDITPWRSPLLAAQPDFAATFGVGDRPSSPVSGS